ncbi:hypothetical protein HMPREF0201_02862 [Cedecea davisae DSM 4568]|uniref:Uncharacterized protein n=1 Tax=Cedecea davisae DSM 4568 TaxID=566551 RepID=S3JTM6_9ENTR|nr:hypothetical protein HMPREF0201_02862 [Cedecea davisae DSM 4568]
MGFVFHAVSKAALWRRVGAANTLSEWPGCTISNAYPASGFMPCKSLWLM